MEPIIERRQGITLDKSEISVVKAAVVLVALLSLGWGIVVTLVIPVSNLTLQVAQINNTLKMYIQTSTQNYNALTAQVTSNTEDIIVIKQELQNLTTSK